MATIEDRIRNNQPWAQIWEPRFLLRYLAEYRKLHGTLCTDFARRQMRDHGNLDCCSIDIVPSSVEFIMSLLPKEERILMCLAEPLGTEDGLIYATDFCN